MYFLYNLIIIANNENIPNELNFENLKKWFDNLFISKNKYDEINSKVIIL